MKEKISELLNRGVEEIIVKKTLEEKLLSGKKLRIKFGIDPTGPKIHIGRAIPLKKLRQFQDLGHHIVLIVGDFTAQIGDASDKLEKRPTLSVEDIEKNLKDYEKHLGKIIDISKAEIVYNSVWLSKLTLKEVTELADSFSVLQMSSRRNFKTRLENGEEVSLLEFMYPLMQGYDSVAVKADVEIGGFDQLFNVKAGRTIQKFYGMDEQDILVTSMLEGTDGRKMSTSWGNVINIDDEPLDMFGKVLSIKDELIIKYFLLCTDISIEEIKKIEEEIKKGENPKKIKERLALEIVSIYHNKEKAEEAASQFEAAFKKGGIPDTAEEVQVKKGMMLSDVLLENSVTASKSDFARLIKEGAIENIETTEKILDRNFSVVSDLNLRVGKKRFLKIRVI